MFYRIVLIGQGDHVSSRGMMEVKLLHVLCRPIDEKVKDLLDVCAG